MPPGTVWSKVSAACGAVPALPRVMASPASSVLSRSVQFAPETPESSPETVGTPAVVSASSTPVALLAAVMLGASLVPVTVTVMVRSAELVVAPSSSVTLN